MFEPDPPVPTRPVTVRSFVVQTLRTAIATGQFRPGEKLVERELCERFGVSRASIREALRQVEAEGLIVTIPHKGPAVARISVEEARQLYEVRALLEGYAGRKFAERRRPEDVAALASALNRLRTAIESGNGSDLLSAKTEFYAALMAGCGNAYVGQMLTAVQNRITVLRFTSMTQPGRSRNSLAEIEAVYDAIVSGDADSADVLCRKHITTAAEIALRVLAESEMQDAPGGEKQPEPMGDIDG